MTQAEQANGRRDIFSSHGYKLSYTNLMAATTGSATGFQVRANESEGWSQAVGPEALPLALRQLKLNDQALITFADGSKLQVTAAEGAQRFHGEIIE